jgi:glyoxylase-like metal-dependent hydrolase (beta-lactamase superfamily II)
VNGAADQAGGPDRPGPVYRVHALRLGTITVDKAGLLDGYPPGTLIDIPVWSAAVEGGGQRILVDTGFADPLRWSAYNRCRQRAEETLPAALAELGWNVRDVDVVINTHLHYDHCENNPALERAEFFVSRAEWEFAQVPVASQNWSYQAAWTGGAVTHRNYHLVSGDYEVAPGLRIIQTPGHTPGHQSVLVDTSEGTLCVAGDAACLLENLTVPLAPAVNTSVELSLQSIRRMQASADRILMNHDPQIQAFQSGGFTAMPTNVPSSAASPPSGLAGHEPAWRNALDVR